jgi:hypothetical protein
LSRVLTVIGFGAFLTATGCCCDDRAFPCLSPPIADLTRDPSPLRSPSEVRGMIVPPGVYILIRHGNFYSVEILADGRAAEYFSSESDIRSDKTLYKRGDVVAGPAGPAFRTEGDNLLYAISYDPRGALIWPVLGGPQVLALYRIPR